MGIFANINKKNRTSQLIHSQTLLKGVNSSIVTLNDNFIEGDTFEVVLKRNSLGLGLSVTGGPEGKTFFVYLLCKLGWANTNLGVILISSRDFRFLGLCARFAHSPRVPKKSFITLLKSQGLF